MVFHDVVSASDRQALVDAGFVETGGRHLRWDYRDGTHELVEFPEPVLEGSFEQVRLSDEVLVNVITVESLVVERIQQATDGTSVTFDEALRLIVATSDRLDWMAVASEIRMKPEAPQLRWRTIS